MSDRGGATLVALGLAGLLLMAGVVAVGALAVARAAAQTAADMAALAALTPRDGWVGGPGQGRGASRAAEIAGANGAELVTCDCSSVQAVVTVRRWLRLVPGVRLFSALEGLRSRHVLIIPAPGLPAGRGRRCPER